LELEARLQSWKMTFEQLLRIADQQLQLLRMPTEDLEPLAALAEEWKEWQAKSDQLAQALKDSGHDEQMKVFFNAEIRPIAMQIQSRVEESEKQLKAQVAVTGEVIKDTKDRRMLMNAYYGMNQNDGISYYVDEKK